MNWSGPDGISLVTIHRTKSSGTSPKALMHLAGTSTGDPGCRLRTTAGAELGAGLEDQDVLGSRCAARQVERHQDPAGPSAHDGGSMTHVVLVRGSAPHVWTFRPPHPLVYLLIR